MRGLTSRAVCALLLALLVGLPTLAAAAPAALQATIPLLTPWLGTHGKPTASTWQHAARFSVNNEYQPSHNLPAPVATEAFVGYTQNALWVHFVAKDPHPKNVQVKYRQHDDVNANDDYVGMLFSPFNETQFSYEFFCSAGGTELDAFRQQGTVYDSYDTIWGCTARRTAVGYDVTIRIPFASMKLPHSGEPQTWRLFLMRNWPRSVQYQTTQVKFNYNTNCTLCSAEVVRTQTPIEAHGDSLLVIPSLTLGSQGTRTAANQPLAGGKLELSRSLDMRWTIRPDLALSATINPNFSQVAPDVLQPTVNRRFTIFYPENRPFFRRGTYVFDTPSFVLGPSSTSNELVDTGQIADPHYATKLIGQVGSNTVGALLADDSFTNILVPGEQSSTLKSFNFPTQDALLRYRYNFANNSDLGLLATVRRGNGYQNDLTATGGTWQIDPSDSVTAQVARSITTYPKTVADALNVRPGTIVGTGASVSFARTRNHYNTSIAVARVSPNFRADLGYVPQVGYTEFYPQFDYAWYSDDDWWNTIEVGGSYDRLDATGGGPTLDRQAQVYALLAGKGQSGFQLSLFHQDQYASGKTFALDRLAFSADAQPVPWLGFDMLMVDGGSVDYVGVRKGQLLSIAPTVTFTPGSHLKIAFVGDFESLDVARGRLYTDNLYDLRASWYFNAHMFVRAIAQNQDIHSNIALYPPGMSPRSRSLATQFLFGYVINPYTSFYAGFSSGYIGTGETGLLQTDREAFLKFSYAFQL